MEKEETNVWKIGFFVLAIIIILMVIFIQLNNTKIKITKIYSDFKEVEEGNRFDITYCNKVNFPIEYLDTIWRDNIFNNYKNCMRYESYYEDKVWMLGETICHTAIFKVNDNLTNDCFGEAELTVEMMGEGLSDEASTTIEIIPKNSQYCKSCKETCEI